MLDRIIYNWKKKHRYLAPLLQDMIASKTGFKPYKVKLEVKAKGFDAFITTEKRASGTTYYIVLVREDKTGNVADRLRSSGYDCYGVE